MKKYVKPTMNGEMFVANEYVGACYVINCNVPDAVDWSGFWPEGLDVYLYSESNGSSGLQTTGSNPDKLILSGNGIGGCDEWHKGVISGTAPSYNGYWVIEDQDPIQVYWWDEELGSAYDVHATTSPQTAKSNPNAS